MVCTFRNWLDPDLHRRRLQPVLQDWWLRFEGPQLYFPSRRMTAPLRAFVDLLAQERMSDQLLGPRTGKA